MCVSWHSSVSRRSARRCHLLIRIPSCAEIAGHRVSSKTVSLLEGAVRQRLLRSRLPPRRREPRWFGETSFGPQANTSATCGKPSRRLPLVVDVSRGSEPASACAELPSVWPRIQSVALCKCFRHANLMSILVLHVSHWQCSGVGQGMHKDSSR